MLTPPSFPRPDHRILLIIIEPVTDLEGFHLLSGKNILDAVEGGAVRHVDGNHRLPGVLRHIHPGAMGE